MNLLCNGRLFTITLTVPFQGDVSVFRHEALTNILKSFQGTVYKILTSVLHQNLSSWSSSFKQAEHNIYVLYRIQIFAIIKLFETSSIFDKWWIIDVIKKRNSRLQILPPMFKYDLIVLTWPAESKYVLLNSKLASEGFKYDL